MEYWVALHDTLIVLPWLNCQRAGWAFSLLATMSLLSFSSSLAGVSTWLLSRIDVFPDGWETLTLF